MMIFRRNNRGANRLDSLINRAAGTIVTRVGRILNEITGQPIGYALVLWQTVESDQDRPSAVHLFASGEEGQLHEALECAHAGVTTAPYGQRP
jgi:hypothetical protein